MLHITLAFNTIFMHNKMADALGETGDGYTIYITKSFLNHQILKTLNEYPNCPNSPKAPKAPTVLVEGRVGWSRGTLRSAGRLMVSDFGDAQVMAVKSPRKMGEIGR